jgi:hypothetical protein
MCETLMAYTQQFDVAIYSSRSKDFDGLNAMMQYLLTHLTEHFGTKKGMAIWDRLLWPTSKPAAWLTIDDRCIQFDGTYPTVTQIEEFKPWYKSKKEVEGEK